MPSKCVNVKALATNGSQICYIWRAVDQEGQVAGISELPTPRKEYFPLTPHITDKWANNRAENSHQMTRVRERKMKKFKSITQAQRFLSAMNEFCDHFQMNRHKTTAKVHRILLNQSLHLWRTIAQNPLIA